MELIKNIEKEAVFNLAAAVPAEAGKVNSLTLSQMPGANVLEGTGEITINGVAHEVHAGESIVIPAGAPHAVRGVTAFKMLLVVILPA